MTYFLFVNLALIIVCSFINVASKSQKRQKIADAGSTSSRYGLPPNHSIVMSLMLEIQPTKTKLNTKVINFSTAL